MQEENSDAQPYRWAEAAPPPPEVLQMWVEVGNAFDKNQTVVWKSAVETLDNVLQYLSSRPQARDFCERYMTAIIGILVEQQPSKIGIHERNCVQESLQLAVRIVAQDLAIQTERRGTCEVLLTLAHVLNKRKGFYKGMAGMPEVRKRMLERFREEGGFQSLHLYLQQHLERGAKDETFPRLSLLHNILAALGDSVSTRSADPPVPDATQEEAILVSKDVMHYMQSLTEEDLKKIPTDDLKLVQADLRRIFDRLVTTRRASTYEFYEFWRSLVLSLITSESIALKLFGWEQLVDLIGACESHRPPPRSFTVSGAGCSFVNGTYEFGADTTPDGYARPWIEFIYVRSIPKDDPDGGGKKLTLFRCVMRSHQKWWFLSEADEDQPGTDRDIDYYQHKAKDYKEAYPPSEGWITCRNAGIDPAPVLEPHSVMVPAGAEFETLEHQLAKWAIENNILGHVLRESTFHQKVVEQTTILIEFMTFVLRNFQHVLGDNVGDNDEVHNPAQEAVDQRKRRRSNEENQALVSDGEQASNPTNQGTVTPISNVVEEIRLSLLMKDDADEMDNALYFVLTQNGDNVVASNIYKLVHDLEGKDWELEKVVNKLKQIHGAAAVREYKQYKS